MNNFIYKYVQNVLSQIPKQYQNLNRQSKEKYDEHHAKLIEELIACDDFEDIATLKVRKTLPVNIQNILQVNIIILKC